MKSNRRTGCLKTRAKGRSWLLDSLACFFGCNNSVSAVLRMSDQTARSCVVMTAYGLLMLLDYDLVCRAHRDLVNFSILSNVSQSDRQISQTFGLN